MKLLIDDRPLQVLPKLAEAIGLNEAILLQQIHYLLRISDNYEAGEDGAKRYWVWKTLSEWEEQFPFWSRKTIRRVLRSLKDQGLLIAEQKRLEEGDSTVWYSIRYEEVTDLPVSDHDDPADAVEKGNDPPPGQNDHMGTPHLVRMTTPPGQNDHPRSRALCARDALKTTNIKTLERARAREGDSLYKRWLHRACESGVLTRCARTRTPRQKKRDVLTDSEKPPAEMVRQTPDHAPTPSQVVRYGEFSAGVGKEECLKFWYHYTAEDWKSKSGRPIRWRAKLGKWKATGKDLAGKNRHAGPGSGSRTQRAAAPDSLNTEINPRTGKPVKK